MEYKGGSIIMLNLKLLTYYKNQLALLTPLIR